MKVIVCIVLIALTIVLLCSVINQRTQTESRCQELGGEIITSNGGYQHCLKKEVFINDRD